MPESGLVAISVTPLGEDGSLDVDSIGVLMQFYLSAGSAGVALLGVMGEANRMTEAESRMMVEHSIDAVGSAAPIIVGVSDASLERVSSLSRFAMEAGAAGVLLQPLPHLAGDQTVAAYFRAAVDSLGDDIPVCVQDFPKANGVHISVEAWRRIVESCPSVVMLKHEDEPSLEKLSALRAAEEAGLRRVTIFTGNNGIQLPQELARGTDGAMTGFGFPDVLAGVCDLHARGMEDEAEELFDRYLPVNVYELRTGIAVRKEILRRRGAIRTAAVRHPGRPLSKAGHAELDRLLDRLEKVSGSSIGEFVLAR